MANKNQRSIKNRLFTSTEDNMQISPFKQQQKCSFKWEEFTVEHQKDDEKNGQIWKEHLFSMLVNVNRTFNFLNFSSRSTIFNILRRRVFINYFSWLFISYKMGGVLKWRQNNIFLNLVFDFFFNFRSDYLSTYSNLKYFW